MSNLAVVVEEYLAIRRSVGFKLKAHQRLLAEFVAYLDRAALETVTTEAALGWATQPTDASRVWWAQRLGVARGFAKYLQCFDPSCQVPPPDLLPFPPRRVQPYIFSAEEIAAIMAQARQLSPPLHAATYETVVGLLASTGLRPGEAMALDRPDVDLEVGLLRVVGAKFGKTRELPLHPSTKEALAAYSKLRDRLSPRGQQSSFFVSASGSRVAHGSLNNVFAQLVRAAGLQVRPGQRRPRPMDLRHTFACAVMTRWYRNGDDVGARLPSLSTWLGHVNPDATYWYLSAVPELLVLASQRMQQRWGGSL